MKTQLFLAGILCLPVVLPANTFFGYNFCRATVTVAAEGFGKQTESADGGAGNSCGATESLGAPGAGGGASVQGAGGFIGAEASAHASGTNATAVADGGASFVDWLQVVPNLPNSTTSGSLVTMTFTVDLHGSFDGDGTAIAAFDVNGGDLHIEALENEGGVVDHAVGTLVKPVNTLFEVNYTLGVGATQGMASFFNTALYHVDVPDGYTLQSLSGTDYSSSAPSAETPEPGQLGFSAIGLLAMALGMRKHRPSV